MNIPTSRRSFLSTIGTAIAGLFVAPRLSATRPMRAGDFKATHSSLPGMVLSPARVRVKPLVWIQDPRYPHWTAEPTLYRYYSVGQRDNHNDWFMISPTNWSSHGAEGYASVDVAKYAAQADWERTVLKALEGPVEIVPQPTTQQLQWRRRDWSKNDCIGKGEIMTYPAHIDCGFYYERKGTQTDSNGPMYWCVDKNLEGKSIFPWKCGYTDTAAQARAAIENEWNKMISS